MDRAVEMMKCVRGRRSVRAFAVRLGTGFSVSRGREKAVRARAATHAAARMIRVQRGFIRIPPLLVDVYATLRQGMKLNIG